MADRLSGLFSFSASAITGIATAVGADLCIYLWGPSGLASGCIAAALSAFCGFWCSCLWVFFGTITISLRTLVLLVPSAAGIAALLAFLALITMLASGGSQAQDSRLLFEQSCVSGCYVGLQAVGLIAWWRMCRLHH